MFNKEQTIQLQQHVICGNELIVYIISKQWKRRHRITGIDKDDIQFIELILGRTNTVYTKHSGTSTGLCKRIVT